MISQAAFSGNIEHLRRFLEDSEPKDCPPVPEKLLQYDRLSNSQKMKRQTDKRTYEQVFFDQKEIRDFVDRNWFAQRWNRDRALFLYEVRLKSYPSGSEGHKMINDRLVDFRAAALMYQRPFEQLRIPWARLKGLPGTENEQLAEQLNQEVGAGAWEE